MSKSILKIVSLRLFIMVATLCFFLLPNPLSAQSRKELNRLADELSYQQAGGVVVPSESKVKNGWGDLNSTVVRGKQQPISRMTLTQQKVHELTSDKAEIQKKIDELGLQLQNNSGSKARKITKVLGLLSNQMALIDAELEVYPTEKTLSESYSDNPPFHKLVDSLVDNRIDEKGYLEASNSTTTVVMAATEPQILYHVQLAVTTRPNLGAFADLSGVEMQQRPNGMYAYYYGNYSNYEQAESACRRLRGSSSYSDAFVVVLRGSQRISIQGAALILAQ